MDNRTASLNNAIAKYVGAKIEADETVKIRLRCVAYPESSKHYADAVLVPATSLTLYVDGTADSTVGSSGVLSFSTYTTLGSLIDAINASDNWQAEIVAGLRADGITGSELLARSSSTFRMYEEVKLYADSSNSNVSKLQYLLEPNSPFEYVTGLKGGESYRGHKVALYRHRSLINTTSGGLTTIKIYELKPDKAVIYKTLGVWYGTDNVEKDSGETNVPICEADYGNSLLVEVYSSEYQDSGAYLQVQGKVV